VLLLAGGGVPPDLAAESGVNKRCLIVLGGKTVLGRMLEALLAALPQARMVVNLGPDERGVELLASCGPLVSHYCCRGGLLEAISEGMAQFVSEQGDGFHDENLLLANVDLPLVRHEHIGEFLRQCAELGADGVWPVVERTAVQAQFPGSKRTYIRTRQGTFTGGNIFLIKPRLLRDHRQLLEKLYQSRKKPLALASAFSSRIVMRVLAGTVSLPEIEQEFSQRFNARLRFLPFAHPEVAVDLDKLSDYRLLRAVLGS